MSGEEQSKQEIWAWLEELRGRDLSDAEVEAVAERLLANREAALPIVLAQFADPEEDASLLAVAAVTLRAWGEPHPTEALTRLLQSRDVGALGKALILNVLEHYGADVGGTDLVGLGINLEEFEIEGGPGGPKGVSRN